MQAIWSCCSQATADIELLQNHRILLKLQLILYTFKSMSKSLKLLPLYQLEDTLLQFALCCILYEMHIEFLIYYV